MQDARLQLCMDELACFGTILASEEPQDAAGQGVVLDVVLATLDLAARLIPSDPTVFNGSCLGVVFKPLGCAVSKWEGARAYLEEPLMHQGLLLKLLQYLEPEEQGQVLQLAGSMLGPASGRGEREEAAVTSSGGHGLAAGGSLGEAQQAAVLCSGGGCKGPGAAGISGAGVMGLEAAQRAQSKQVRACCCWA